MCVKVSKNEQRRDRAKNQICRAWARTQIQGSDVTSGLFDIQAKVDARIPFLE